MSFIELKKYLDCENDDLKQWTTGTRGIYSKVNIFPNTTIMKIPSSKMIQISCIPYFSLFKSSVHNHNSILAFYLSMESTKQTNSRIHLVLQMMPSLIDLHHYPHFIDTSEFDLLKQLSINSHLFTFVLHMIQDYRTLYEKRELFIPYMKNFEFPSFYLYFYYRILTTSRVFGYLRSNQKETALVPYADLLNHSDVPNTRWFFDDFSKSFIVQSTKYIRYGQEIFDSYGNQSNNILFMYYGFTLIPKIEYPPEISKLLKNDKSLISFLLKKYQKHKTSSNTDIQHLSKEDIHKILTSVYSTNPTNSTNSTNLTNSKT